MDHCNILDSGIAVALMGQLATVQAVVTDSLLETCETGVNVDSAASVQITNCTIAGATNTGVSVFSTTGTGAAPARAVIEGCTLTYNPIAIFALASGGNNSAIVYIAHDEISFSPTGILTSGGTVKTYGNNRFSEVTAVGPLSLVALQ